MAQPQSTATKVLGWITGVVEAFGGGNKTSRKTPRVLPTRVTEEQFTEAFVSHITRLPIRAKQALMLDLYADKNMFLERLIDFLVNPIVGRQGFIIDVNEGAPKTKETFRRFTRLNGLNIPKKQRGYVRDGFLTGELFFLKVWNHKRDTYQLIQVPTNVIRQTIVDPGNYNEIIAVEQELGFGSTMMHKIIMDEDILTQDALRLRSSMKFECFAFQNCKRSHPMRSPYGTDLLHKYEIRGEPYLMNSADLLEALVAYLWKTMDKMDSWNRFNYKFTVDVPGTEQEDIQTELDDWARFLGTPQPNSAIYLPKDLITMEPVSFPMQTGDMSQFYRMVRNATAWHGGTRETSMGEGDVKYASNQAPGVSEPSIETKEIFQRDQEDFYKMMYDDVGCEALRRGQIPSSELKEENPPEFQYTIISNEISKVSQEGTTKAFAVFSDTAIKLKEEGIATPESLHHAVIQKAQELLAIELIEPEQVEKEKKVQPVGTPENQEETEVETKLK